MEADGLPLTELPKLLLTLIFLIPVIGLLQEGKTGQPFPHVTMVAHSEGLVKSYSGEISDKTASSMSDSLASGLPSTSYT